MKRMNRTWKIWTAGLLIVTAVAALSKACGPSGVGGCCRLCETGCYPEQPSPNAIDGIPYEVCEYLIRLKILTPCLPITPESCGSVGFNDTVWYMPQVGYNEQETPAKYRLNYRVPELPPDYGGMPFSQAIRIDDTNVSIMLKTAVVNFEKIDGQWQQVMAAGRIGPNNLKLSVSGDFSELTLTEQVSHLPRTFTFDGARGAGQASGRLLQIDQAGGSIQYAFQNGKLDTATCAYGKVTHYFYDAGTGYLKYIVRPSANGLNDLYGPIVRLTYSGQYITKMEQGTPKSGVATPTYTDEDDYEWHTTVYWHDQEVGNLKYVVAPEYSGGPDGLSGGSDEDLVKVKAHMTFLYSAPRVVSQAIFNGNHESVGTTDSGVKFSVGDIEDLCPGGNPTGRNEIVRQVNLQHPRQETLSSAVSWYTDEKVQLNADGHLIVRYRNVKASGEDSVRLEKHLYRDLDGRPEYVCSYSHNPADDIDDATLARVTKYEYNDDRFCQYVKVSPNGSTWTNKARYDRDATHKGRVTASYVYVDNNTPYGTDYSYDASGRLTEIQQPTVTYNTGQAGGEPYRPTTEYSYDAHGNLATETVYTGPEAEDTIVTKYLYGYNDGNGTGGFERTKVIADYGDASHLNLTTVYTYTKQNNQWRLTGMTDPKGNDTTFSVSAWGLRETETTPEGYVTTWTYDENGRVTQTERKDGSANTLSQEHNTYDVFGHLRMSKSDPNGDNLATVDRHDKTGQLREVWTRVHNASVSGESPTGDIYGNKTQYEYQYTTALTSDLKQAAHDNDPVKIVSYTYDAFGRTTVTRRYRASDNDHNDTANTYDWQGRLTAVDGPAGEYTEYVYDERDLTVEVENRQDDGNGARLAYSKTYYDQAGRVYKTEVVNPDHTAYARTTNYYLDKAGRTKRITDPGNHNTDYDHDTAGRLYKVTDHAENRTLYTLDPNGQQVLVQTVHELGATDRVELVFTWLDGDGRATTVANYGINEPDGWDPEDDPPAWDDETWPDEPASSSGDCLVSKYAYGYAAGTGPLTEVTDPEGTVAQTTLDILGRVVSVVEDHGEGNIQRTTTYAYDQASGGDYYDRITAENGAEDDEVTKFWHTDTVDASRVTKVTYPETGYVTYAFYRDGVPNTRTDQRNWTITYTADGSGRIIQEAIAGTGVVGTDKVTATYDGLGRMTQITDNNGNVSDEYSRVDYAYAWDDESAGAATTETHYLAGSAMGTLTVEYNAEGLRSKLTYPNGRYVEFAHDSLHRLETITDDDDTVLADYEFKGYYLHQRDTNDSALRLTSHNQADLDGYDDFGRTKWMRHYDVSGPTDVVMLEYDRDYVGSPKYQEDQVNGDSDELYGYDSLHRLTSFKRGNLNALKTMIAYPVREQSWTLQHVGNWDAVVSKINNGNDDSPYDTRTHDTDNEIVTIDPQGAIGTFTVVHDAAGNLSVLPDRTDLSQAERYTCDYRNRLIKIEHSDDYDEETPTWATVVQYEYDGLNRRVKKDLASGTDVVYLYSGWQVIEEQEYDAGDEAWEGRRQYVYGGLYIDEPVALDVDDDSDGDCTEGNGGSTRYLYAQNANFNVMALTDHAGSAVETVKYDPYGQPTCRRVSDSHEQPASHFGNVYLFAARRYDGESGLYYFRNRYHHPGLGRFVQPDRAGFGSVVNRYQFTEGRPTMLLDPKGLCAVWQDPQSGAVIWYDPASVWMPPSEWTGDTACVPLIPPTEPPQMPWEIPLRSQSEGPIGTPAEYPSDIWGGPRKAPRFALGAQLEVGCIIGGGKAIVVCCDENNQLRVMQFAKFCFGAWAGGSLGPTVIYGVRGETCRPETYSNFFLEWGVTVGIMGIGGEHGIEPSRPITESPFTGVHQVSGGLSVGAKVKLCVVCYYIFERYLDEVPAGAASK